MTELQAFKTDLTTFLRESALAMEARADQLTPPKGQSFQTQKEKTAVLELLHMALAHMNLVTMIDEGVFQ